MDTVVFSKKKKWKNPDFSFSVETLLVLLIFLYFPRTENTEKT